MVRGVGDVIERQGSWLSWFSPCAWAQQTRVYVDLRWWPLMVSFAVIVAGLVIAGALSRRRDVGGGLRPASAGPEQASSVLLDRKSTRLNSSHVAISYAVFCLKK